MEGKMFGQRVRALRQQAQVRQTTLAKILGYTTNGMNQIELGHIADPHISHVIRAARFFGVSSDYLLGLTDDQSSQQSADTTAVDLLQEVCRKVCRAYTAIGGHDAS